MHIVQLANFYTETSGGLRTVLNELGARYAESGHRVTRIVPAAYSSDRIEHGVRVITIEAPRVPGMAGYRAIFSVATLGALLVELRPDVIELSDKTTLVGATTEARRRGARVVLLSHERIDAILQVRTPGLLPLSAVADRWNRRLAGRVDAIVCASDFAADEFRRIGVSGVHGIPLGVDLDTFRPISRPPYRFGAAPPTILTVGRLSAEKRAATVIEAAHRLHAGGTPVRVVLAGEGPQRQRLERAAGGLDVHFLGHVAGRSAVASIMAAADIVIAPCSFETFGLSALEALACGTPVVVPNQGALSEVVTSTCGRVVADHPIAFATAIRDLLLHADLPTCRVAARQRAEHFSWATTTTSLLRLFADLSNSQPSTFATTVAP